MRASTPRDLRRALVTVVLAFAAATAASCSSSGAGDGQASSTPTADESDGAASGGESNTTVQSALVAADSVFDFDPTIDPSATPTANAQSIGDYAKSNLAGCGSVQVSGATVTISFGAPPGCTLASGVVVSGTVKATVTQSGATTSVALSFEALVVAGKSVAGTMTLATTNGSTFQVTLALTTSGGTFSGTVTVSGAAGSFVVDGTIASVQSGTSGSETFAGVSYKLGDCYPNGGSLTIVRGAIKETMAFTSTTPTTGTVSVTVGRKTYPAQLPAYGSCPGAGWGGGRGSPDAGAGDGGRR